MRLKYLIYIDKIVKTCILMCVCIIEFVVVLFKNVVHHKLNNKYTH
jgi:hypothetical protein